MAFQLSIQYRNTTLVYDVSVQEEQVYLLRLSNENQPANGEYVPEKIVIRRKGKLWVSDMDNNDELFNCLIKEIIRFAPDA